MHFIDDFDLWEYVKEKKAEGIIRHIGISFHSTPGELETILQTHPEAEFVQLQINYADWEEPSIQSRGVYEMARKYGKRVVIMEPLKGGLLANSSETVANVLKSADPDLSYASWGIRFAADLDGVLVALSGMSDLAQMEDNISYMKDFTGLTEEQSTVIDRARKELEKIPLIPCTSCNYCAKVCPKENGISGTFTAKNIYALYGNKAIAAGRER